MPFGLLEWRKISPVQMSTAILIRIRQESGSIWCLHCRHSSRLPFDKNSKTNTLASRHTPIRVTRLSCGTGDGKEHGDGVQIQQEQGWWTCSRKSLRSPARRFRAAQRRLDLPSLTSFPTATYSFPPPSSSSSSKIVASSSISLRLALLLVPDDRPLAPRVNILSTLGRGDRGEKAGNGDDDGEGREARALVTTAMRNRQ